MQRLTGRILPTAIAIATGLIVLLGYLIPPLVPEHTQATVALIFLRDQLIRWAVVVAAFAFILGFFNILRVHLRRIRRGRQNAFYSSLLILAALASLIFTLAGSLVPSLGESQAATILAMASDGWFRYVLSPLQASAAALIALSLALGAFRLLKSRKNLGALLFLLSAVIVLAGTVSLPGSIGQQLAALREWWITVPVMAGMRGLLIGVGLGILLMGLRVIVGLDRPHSNL